MGTKQRRHNPNELFGRFSSKADFIKYFREQSKVLVYMFINSV